MNELYNTYIKNNIILKFIIFSVFSFLFYTIITKIFIFFGVNSVSIYLYMSWMIFLFSLFVFLPSINGLISYSDQPFELSILSIYKSVAVDEPEPTSNLTRQPRQIVPEIPLNPAESYRPGLIRRPSEQYAPP